MRYPIDRKHGKSLMHLPSVPTIYGLVQKAEIPVNKKGKRLYFSHSELTEWIKSGRRKTNIELNAEAEQYLQSNKKGGKR